jgi:hypothetical protein
MVGGEGSSEEKVEEEAERKVEEETYFGSTVESWRTLGNNLEGSVLGSEAVDSLGCLGSGGNSGFLVDNDLDCNSSHGSFLAHDHVDVDYDHDHDHGLGSFRAHDHVDCLGCFGLDFD